MPFKGASHRWSNAAATCQCGTSLSDSCLGSQCLLPPGIATCLLPPGIDWDSPACVYTKYKMHNTQSRPEGVVTYLEQKILYSKSVKVPQALVL